MILKHLFNLSDRKLLKQLNENIYYMLFCDVSPEDIIKARQMKIIDRTTFVKIRGRIGKDRIRKIERLFFKQLNRCHKRSNY